MTWLWVTNSLRILNVWLSNLPDPKLGQSGRGQTRCDRPLPLLAKLFLVRGRPVNFLLFISHKVSWVILISFSSCP